MALRLPAAAAAPLVDGVVKITSTSIADGTIYRGSGLALKYKSDVYVLTSDHVVLHGLKGIEQVISGDALSAPLQAAYLISDFGRGLALLKVQSPPASWQLNSIDEIQFSQNKIGDASYLMGYPGLSDSMIRDGRGRIKDLARPMQALVFLPTMIEIEKGHGEFGMSGGAVANASDQFIGVLSHQIYTESSDSIDNVILVIPGEFAIKWAMAFLTNPLAPPVEIVQTIADQNWGRGVAATTGAIQIEMIDAFGNGTEELSMTDTSDKAPQILLGPNGDFKKYETLLNTQPCVVYTLFFRKRDEPFSNYANPKGMVEILRTFLDPKAEAVNYAWCNGGDDIKDHLEEYAQKIWSYSDKNKSTPASVLMQTLDNYASNVQQHSGESLTFAEIKPSDWLNLITDEKYKASWDYLKQSGQSAEIETFIRELADKWKLLSI
jgi:S1-C subfamily serine protease